VKLNGLFASVFILAVVVAGLLSFGSEHSQSGDARCPVSGEPASDEFSMRFKGATLRFSSVNCLREFKQNQARYASDANRQLFATAQATQIKCPLTGKLMKEDLSANVGGDTVKFCCEACRDTVVKTAGDEQINLVFGNKTFTKAFRVKSNERPSAKMKVSKTDKSGSKASQKSASQTADEPTIDTALVQKAIEIQDRHTTQLMQMSGVAGTGIAADSEGNPVINVYVNSQDPTQHIPAQLEGTRVQIEVIGSVTPIDPSAAKTPSTPTPQPQRAAKPTGLTSGVNPSSRFTRPVPIGVSTGNQAKCMTGTIGCRLKDGNGNYYALSNNHIFALQNKASLDSGILQPGLNDTSCKFVLDNSIGSLQVYKQIFFGGVTNVMDAALARSSAENLTNATPSDGYGTPRQQTVSAKLGQKVKKYGKSTGLTNGTVTAVNVTLNIRYSSGTATFVKQIIVSGTNFTKAGDSGSLLVADADNSPVGLLFAQVNSSVAVANPISEVLNEFRKTIPTLAIDGN
jgi:YHS domain-containing protein